MIPGLEIDGGAGKILGAGPGANPTIELSGIALAEAFPRLPATTLPPPLPALLPPLPPRAEPPRPFPSRDGVAPGSCCSAWTRAVFVVRALRFAAPPREPGPRTGRPVSGEMGMLEMIGTWLCAEVLPRPAPRPRPRPRLIVPSALVVLLARSEHRVGNKISRQW